MNKDAIRDALVTKMVSGSWDEPIQWPNFKFDAPNAEPFLRFNVMFPADNMLTLNSTDRQPVLLQVDIFTPRYSNDFKAQELTDKLQALFSKKERITFSGGYLQPSRFSAMPSQNDNYYRVMCEVDFDGYVERV